MLPYYLMAGGVAALSLTSETVRQRIRTLRPKGSPEPKARWTLFDYFAVALLVAFSALRFEVGTDYEMYARRFAALYPGKWVQQLEQSPQECPIALAINPA